MNDGISELLDAERRGRALALPRFPSPGATWLIRADDTPNGHALLAAARWAARLGARVVVELARVPSPSPVWRILAESAGLQGLAGTVGGEGVRLAIGGGEGWGEEEIPLSRIPDPGAAWRLGFEESGQAVRPADADAPAMSCAQCREIDGRAIRSFGVPGVCLMENAAIAAALVTRETAASTEDPVLVVAGGGNNGGDGLALARGLWGLGRRCGVALLKPEAGLSGDAGVNRDLLRELTGVPVYDLSGRPDGLERLAGESGVIVDALLGTGFSGRLSPAFRRAVDIVNASGKPVVALDIPSGLNGDSGEVIEAAVRASRTVTFAAVKTGLRAGSGPEYTGRLYLGDIGAPSAAMARDQLPL